MLETDNHESPGSTKAFAALLRQPLCSLLRELNSGHPGHLVGGVLRDSVLGALPLDIDLVVAGRGRQLARRLAEELGTRVVILGGDRFAAFRIPSGGTWVDIWDRREQSLEEDLRRRDFTIHSLALDLETGTVIDPFGGLEDLAARCLRMTSNDSFVADPLRVMRLCRFASQLEGFVIDSETLIQARRSASHLHGMASERIRSEIEATLESTRSAIGVDLWVQLDVVTDALWQIPRSDQQREDLRCDLRIAFKRLAVLSAMVPTAVDHTATGLALIIAVIERRGILAAHESADSLHLQGLMTKATANRVALILKDIVLPADESDQRWWLHNLGPLWPSGLCLAATLASLDEPTDIATEKFNALRKLATESAMEIFAPPGLVSGDDLMNHLGIEPGAELGRLLARIRRLQIEGSLHSRRQALEAAALLASENGRS